MDKKLRNNLVLNVTYHLLAIFVPFITAPYLGRVLGAEQVGTYTYVQSIVSYFTYFAMLGLSNYGNREIAKVRSDKEKRSRIFFQIYAMQLITAGMSVVVYLIYALLSDTSYSSVTLWMTIWVVSNLLDVGWYCMGMEQFKTIVFRNVIIKALNITAILCFVKTANDLNKYTFIMAFGQLLSQMILWIFVRKEVDFIPPKWREIIPHWKPNILLFLPAIASSIYQIMDKIMIGAISTKTDLAFYEYADKIIQIPSLVFSAMGTVMLSRMSNLAFNDSSKGKALTSISMDFSLILASASSFGLAAIADELVKIYYGDEFLPSGRILFALTPVIFLYAWSNVIRMQYIIPNGKDSVYIKATVSGAIANLFMNSIFIPRYGALGATLGTIMAQLVVALIFGWYSKNDLPLKKYVVTNLPCTVLGIIMFIAIKCFQNFHSISLTGLIMDVILGGIIFVVGCLVYAQYAKEHFLTIIWKHIKNMVIGRKKI